MNDKIDYRNWEEERQNLRGMFATQRIRKCSRKKLMFYAVVLTNTKSLEGDPDETNRLSNGIKLLLEAKANKRSDLAILIACLSVVVNIVWDIWQGGHPHREINETTTQSSPAHTTNSPRQ
jgi:hypothetical protein